MTDEYLIERGYKEYNPTPFDNSSIVKRFQKRFDDDYGKKYFINAIKWSHDYVPVIHRDKYWTPFSYEYETQISMSEEHSNTINLNFFSDWTIEKVENFMEQFFEKMKPNYYETWNED